MTEGPGGARRPRSVYAGARVEELEEPLLPRWFILLAIGLVPIALGVAVWAFVVFGPEEVPFAERRPPPSPDGLTTEVGQYNVGESEAIELATSCNLVEGIRGAGSETDRERIALAVDALCEVTLPVEVAQRLVAFGRAQGEVRFAQFQATGIDSTMDFGVDPPRLLLNARFASETTDPLWITPLLVHDTTYLDLDAAEAASALAAREAEDAVCAQLFEVDRRPSRACDDAAEVLDLLDPVRALQAAGFS